MTEKVIKLLNDKKYNDLHNFLETLNCADIAMLLEEFDGEDLIVIYRLLSKEKAVDTFSYIAPTVQEKLIEAFTDKELKEVTSKLFLDDTVALIGEMPSNVVKRILKHTNPDQRKLINEILNYPDDSAGSIMTIEFVDLKSHLTVEEAFSRIRAIGLNKETIYTCYVLNESRLLEGIVTVKDLLLADKATKICDIMEKNLIVANTLEDKEEVAKKFNKYDLLAIPVVDQENRLVGIITIDDAIDVIQDENTEDFEKMAAMSPAEDTYFRTSVFQHAKNRIMWLLVLMVSATITGEIINRYNAAFAAIPLLVSFIPMLMDTGGNCGSQSSTLVIRGLAVDEIRLKDFFKVLWKEIRVAVIVGIVLAFVTSIRILIQYNYVTYKLKLSLVIGLSLVVTVTISKTLGCILPMLAKKLNVDPAIMAAPLITTIVDTCSIMIYFTFALHILNI